jgi:hypothetical protein
MAKPSPGKQSELRILPDPHHDLLPGPKRHGKGFMEHDGDRNPAAAEGRDEPRGESAAPEAKRIVLNDQPVEAASFPQGLQGSVNGLRSGGIEGSDDLDSGWLLPNRSKTCQDGDLVSLFNEGLRKPPGVVTDTIELWWKGAREQGDSHSATGK